MNGRIVAIVGAVLALWMSVGRWAFGIGGTLSWWYAPTIGLGFLALHLWLARRLRITRDRGKRTSRSTIVSLTLSWACAIGFGLTVPDRAGDELVSILSLAAGSGFSAEMSIALCNPFGILAFALLVAALGFSAADARDPKPEEDEIPGEGGMVRHPLA
ncbi:hypothetical protein MUN78_13555 [Leucobacter allii]|uniref:Uncharacterized protein n=1 Tax=Leucobacter allii TaxID=2932247 RepID=A0ABY4FK30_9MICO|nr:hypothetical protein [Leucobacter allii]UOQ56686.1 hypothetical protein MUN78_13555 [Leucobacter allii]